LIQPLLSFCGLALLLRGCFGPDCQVLKEHLKNMTRKLVLTALFFLSMSLMIVPYAFVPITG